MYDTLAKDVGKEFDLKAQINPDITKTMYIATKISAILYAVWNYMTLLKAVHDNTCQKFVTYYVKYSYNGNCQRNDLELHGAYTCIHHCGQEKYMIQDKAQVLGATSMII